MASKLNPRASRLDLRPDLRVMMYPIKLDQREIAALAEINRQYRDGDVQVYVGTDRDTLARIAGAKTLDTGVEFLLGLDRVTGRYLAAPVEWVEQVARMTAVAIDQGLIPEPPEDPEPPPMPRSKGRATGRSAFPGGKMRNPRYQPLDKARFIADLNSLWKGKDLPEAPRDYSLYPENLNRPGQTPSHITMTWLAARALQQQFPNIHYHQAKSTNSVYVNGYPFGQNEIRISGHSKYGRLGPLDVHNWSSKPTLADRLAVAVQAAQLGAKTFPELAKLLKEPDRNPNKSGLCLDDLFVDPAQGSDVDDDNVEQMVDALRSGKVLPPILALTSGQIIEGHHRYAAHKIAKQEPSIVTISRDQFNAWRKEGLSREDMEYRATRLPNPPAQPCSGTTQVATTTGSYRKAAEMLKDFLAKRPRARVLDYGAGLGLGTEAMRGVLDGIATVEGFEPLPGRAKVQPDYTDSRQIRAKYDGIVNLNVLNVLERGLRDRVLLDIASRLAPGGFAIIGTRKYIGDIDKAKGASPGPEPGSIWLVKSGQQCYQKGFDGNELLEYASDLLGSGYRVRKLSGPAANNIEIERLGKGSRNPHPISPYSDPRLHDRIKDRILASDKGGRPGQWSARKAQLVAQAYEAAGGGYTGRRTPAQASLSRWTREDWGTRSGKPSIQGPAATGERYLPRAVRESMPDKVYTASTRAKRASIAAGRQFSPQPGPARAYTTLHRTRIA